jgi:hypothetical protein
MQSVGRTKGNEKRIVRIIREAEIYVRSKTYQRNKKKQDGMKERVNQPPAEKGT